jgi:hypothetical protein
MHLETTALLLYETSQQNLLNNLRYHWQIISDIASLLKTQMIQWRWGEERERKKKH